MKVMPEYNLCKFCHNKSYIPVHHLVNSLNAFATYLFLMLHLLVSSS